MQEIISCKNSKQFEVNLEVAITTKNLTSTPEEKSVFLLNSVHAPQLEIFIYCIESP